MRQLLLDVKNPEKQQMTNEKTDEQIDRQTLVRFPNSLGWLVHKRVGEPD